MFIFLKWKTFKNRLSVMLSTLEYFCDKNACVVKIIVAPDGYSQIFL